MPDSVFHHLESFLAASGATWEVLRHQPVFTSEEAASVRGTPLSSGAKALICRADDRSVMIVLPADRRLSGRPFGGPRASAASVSRRARKCCS